MSFWRMIFMMRMYNSSFILRIKKFMRKNKENNYCNGFKIYLTMINKMRN